MRIYNQFSGRHVDISSIEGMDYQLQECIWYDKEDFYVCNYLFKGEVTRVVQRELNHGASIIDFSTPVTREEAIKNIGD